MVWNSLSFIWWVSSLIRMKLSKIALNLQTQPETRVFLLVFFHSSGLLIFYDIMIKDPFVSSVSILGLQKIHSFSASKVNHVKKQKHDLDLHHPDEFFNIFRIGNPYNLPFLPWTWKITLNERKLIWEIHPFATSMILVSEVYLPLANWGPVFFSPTFSGEGQGHLESISHPPKPRLLTSSRPICFFQLF